MRGRAGLIGAQRRGRAPHTSRPERAFLASPPLPTLPGREKIACIFPSCTLKKLTSISTAAARRATLRGACSCAGGIGSATTSGAVDGRIGA